MTDGRREVLLAIDLQDEFITDETRPVMDFVSGLVQTRTFDTVIHSYFVNYECSPFMKRLGYTGCMSVDAKPLRCDAGKWLMSRSTYSAVTPEFLRGLLGNEFFYVVGLESDACVLATLFDLWDNGFEFRVFREGIGTNAPGLQGPVLSLIERQFGDILI